MSRRTVAWLLAVPLAVAGSQLAHESAYRLVSPGEQARAHELAASGHTYLAYLPLVAAIGVVLVTLALVGEIHALVASPHGREARMGAWTFAVMAPAIFVCQEHLERLAHDGSFPWHAALAPTFGIGLLLQFPFALIAYLGARILLGAARTLGRLLAAPPKRASAIAPHTWYPARSFTPRVAPLARGFSSRAPPIASL